MNFNASKHEYLIATHVSMLAIATRSLVLRKSHGEILRILSTGQQRRDILSGISETKWMRKGVEKEDFLEMNRNFDGHQYDSNNKLAEGDSDLIQYAHYPMLLPELQEGLWKYDRLGHLYIEELFNDGKALLM